ncbi:hypothetical protein CSX11_20365 [Mycobacterium goodii]|nr:hypothetical protein CSX11_20365 [Mycolicibacterium goodii]
MRDPDGDTDVRAVDSNSDRSGHDRGVDLAYGAVNRTLVPRPVPNANSLFADISRPDEGPW